MSRTGSGDPVEGRVGRTLRNLRTARHIPASQLLARAKFVRLRRAYAADPERPLRTAREESAGAAPASTLPRLPFEVVAPEGQDEVRARAEAFADGRFEYLSRQQTFERGIPWREIPESPLWVYQLQVLGAVRDLALVGRTLDAARLLTSWRTEYQDRWDAVAWHPYPASLRLANLCHAAAALGTFDELGADTAGLVAAHAAYVLAHLETDVRGNHLLENARALVLAGEFFTGPLAQRCAEKGRSLLRQEVPEQVLADGGHFELSPLYHTIVMHRLVELAALMGEGDEVVRDVLAPAIGRMAAWLSAVLCPDGDIPLLGDSVRGFGPPPNALLRLAGAASREGPSTSLDATGLHVWRAPRIWAILDAGPVCPDYLPAHGQADSLTVEVWIDGVCVVGDPGVHDYTGEERAWGRSSRAHSTLTLDDRDNSEVFGSFRVGGRARIVTVERDGDAVTASLRPWYSPIRFTRTVRPTGDGGIEISDVAGPAPDDGVRARLHLHPAVTVAAGEGTREVTLATPSGRVRVRASHPVSVESGRASRRFGRIEPTSILVMSLSPGETDPCGDVSGRFVLEPKDGD